MFEQLRIKVAIRQSLAMGIMLVIILTLIFTYNAMRISANIDRKLEQMRALRYNVFFGMDLGPDGVYSDKDRDTLAILVDNNDKVFLSDIGFYDTDTVEKIIDVATANKSSEGRANVNGNFIAYSIQSAIKGTVIYVYDYSRDYENLRNITVIIVIAGAIGMVAIALLSFKFAKNSVAPIEDTFNKQQDLVANASHELKTPITIINTDLSILNSTRDTMTEEQCKWLDSINNQLDRMNALVTEMLELAKIEGTRDNKQLVEKVNMSTVAESVVLETEALAFEHNITLREDITPDVIISAVPAHIEKLVYILIENAMKYTNEGGTVTLSVTSERKKAILKMRNTGEGIERDKIPKLFDRFYRTDEAHSASNNFGLGLAIAKSIVDAHNGTIGVESKVGEFTEFIVIFPSSR